MLARKVIKRGNFKSTAEFKKKIMAFIDYFNDTMAKPFKWTSRQGHGSVKFGHELPVWRTRLHPLIFGQAWTNTEYYATIIAVNACLSFITSPLGRACLVVNVWWYMPIWHNARTMSTGLVAWLAWVNGWSFEVFLLMLVVQMSTLYLIDYCAEWRFSACSRAGDIKCAP
jgi:hypothetical protein